GDGIDDLLLGGATDTNVRRWNHQVALVRGPVTDLQTALDQREVVAEGPNVSGGLEIVGDLDGDGAEDFVHRGPLPYSQSTDPADEDRSRFTVLLYLSSRGLDDPIAIIDDEDSAFGSSISRSGDLDGDGLPDFAIGASMSDKIYIVYGKRLRELALEHRP